MRIILVLLVVSNTLVSIDIQSDDYCYYISNPPSPDMSDISSNNPHSQPNDADSLFSDYSSFMKEGSSSSDGASNANSNNTQKHYISREKESIVSKTSSIPSTQPINDKEPREPVLTTSDPHSDDNAPRSGKIDWHSDVSRALSLSSGQWYGCSDHQRGYLSGNFVTPLSYPEPVAPAPETRGGRLQQRLRECCSRLSRDRHHPTAPAAGPAESHSPHQEVAPVRHC